MNQILADLEPKLKTQTSLLEIERILLVELSAIFCAVLAACLELWDQQICAEIEDVQILRRDSRELNGILGNIKFKRRLVRYANGEHGYPLDRKLGLKPHRRFTPLLTSIVAKLGAHSPYRVTAMAVTNLTATAVSHMTVKKLVDEAGDDLEVVRQSELEVTAAPTKLKSVPVLYLEGDAFMVKLQHQRRIMVHRFQVFEGVAYSGKNGKRHELISRHSVTLLKRDEAVQEMSAYLKQNYDLTQTMVISSSDNGSGYEAAVFTELALNAQQQVHVLDRYHLNRKLRERLPQQAKLAKHLLKTLYQGDWQRVEVALNTAYDWIESEADSQQAEQFEALRKLRAYLVRNWDYIQPLSDESLKGQLIGIGSCESNHRRYTYRLKHQGRSWSEAGLAAQLRIIDAEQNGDYEQRLIVAGQIQDASTELKEPMPVQSISRHLFKKVHEAHLGVRDGHIALNAATSSPIGNLAKYF